MTTEQPLLSLDLNGSHVTLLGTAHVSRVSADKVQELLATGEFDAVAIELCPSRYHALNDPDSLSKMDLFQVIRTGKAPTIIASLALGAFQQRIADQFGIEPGAEMRAAIHAARKYNLSIVLLDREIGTTLKRIYRNVPWWRRIYLFAGLIASVVSRENISEEEVEHLKEGDILERAFAQFADQAQELYVPLVKERDRYMAAQLQKEITKSPRQRILAVVGAGHLQGIHRHLLDATQSPESIISNLDQVPVPSRWPKLLPWLIVILILIGFVIGFNRSEDLGWQLITDWIVINGGLAALGALIAAAHPLTILGAFVAAPITSLNPTIGAGIVTAAIEIYIRKPRVGDFNQLRKATTHIKGWWQNRVTRILLIFLLSTLGSAAGTYLAGYRIFEQLTS